MKNAIDDKDNIINWSIFITYPQWLRNFCYSHSIINKSLKVLIFNKLFQHMA
jgi:hypothetical protein